MAIPASYTETTLKDYMHDVLSAVATSLGWLVANGDYDEALNESLLVYGTDDVTTVTGRDNLQKLRIAARLEAWRAAMAEVSGDFDFKADGGDYKRSQMFKHIKDMFEQAVSDAANVGLGPLYELSIDKVIYEDDWYRHSATTDDEFSRVN